MYNCIARTHSCGSSYVQEGTGSKPIQRRVGRPPRTSTRLGACTLRRCRPPAGARGSARSTRLRRDSLAPRAGDLRFDGSVVSETGRSSSGRPRRMPRPGQQHASARATPGLALAKTGRPAWVVARRQRGAGSGHLRGRRSGAWRAPRLATPSLTPSAAAPKTPPPAPARSWSGRSRRSGPRSSRGRSSSSAASWMCTAPCAGWPRRGREAWTRWACATSSPTAPLPAPRSCWAASRGWSSRRGCHRVRGGSFLLPHVEFLQGSRYVLSFMHRASILPMRCSALSE